MEVARWRVCATARGGLRNPPARFTPLNQPVSALGRRGNIETKPVELDRVPGIKLSIELTRNKDGHLLAVNKKLEHSRIDRSCESCREELCLCEPVPPCSLDTDLDGGKRSDLLLNGPQGRRERRNHGKRFD